MTYRFEFLLPFVLYLIVLVVIGFLAYKKTKTMEGFHLGNRQLSPWVAGISILFSGSSGWIFLGCAGLGYSMGPSGMVYAYKLHDNHADRNTLHWEKITQLLWLARKHYLP